MSLLAPMSNPHHVDQLNSIISNWKLTPATFAHKISHGRWIPSKHLMYISARVAKGIAKGGARIIISAPPRHGKSQLTSIYTPAWVLEVFPWMKVILSTYGADLSVGFGRAVRDILSDPVNYTLLNTRLRQDSKRVAFFQTALGGAMASVGLGGPITGRGADVLLIDDYIKEIKEALSPAYRDYVWNWFITTAFTRLEPNGSCIIIATRWHSDDLIGRILKNFPGLWEYIEIPAIAEENDVLGRPVGSALFEERYPLSALLELKETLGSAFFNALYQQRPLDETNKITDYHWLTIIPRMPNAEFKVIRMWDLAATEGGGDFTVGTKMAYNKNTGQTIIMDVKRGQLSSGKAEELVRDVALNEDGPDVVVGVEQEPGASGKALVNHYKVNILPEFSVRAIPVVVNKLIRAQPFLAAAEAGKVSLLEGKWNLDFVKEFDTFPGDYDDQMDTASAGYSELSGKKFLTASWGRTKLGTQNSTKLIAAGKKMSKASFSIRGATFGRGKRSA